MSDNAGQRAEALAVGILAPLVLGGPMELQRPFGAKLALTIGEGRSIVDNDLRARVDTARLRVARSVVSPDTQHERSGPVRGPHRAPPTPCPAATGPAGPAPRRARRGEAA